MLKPAHLRVAFFAALAVAALIALVTIHLHRQFIDSFPLAQAQPSEDPVCVHASPSESQKQHLLDGNFTIIRNTTDLPPNIRSAFATVTRTKPFALANPGEKFQETDVIYEEGLPRRRLLFAGVSNNRWFIHYEYGGWGHGYAILMFTTQPDRSVLFTGSSLPKKASNLDDLRAAIAVSDLNDSTYY